MIKKDNTKIIGPNYIEADLNVVPEEKYEIDGIKFETVPAYNLNKEFHKPEYNWVGYIIEIDGERVYHAGDTDKIPAMEDINCEIAMLPIGGTYTMTWKEGVQAIKTMKHIPKKVIPMHYKTIVGSEEDAIKFKQELENIVEVIIIME